MENKVCSQCGVEKPISDFHFRKDHNNYRANCKACCLKKHAEWRGKTHEIRKIKDREYNDKNKEHKREYNIAYRDKNEEKLKDYAKEHYKNNKTERNKKSKEAYLKNRDAEILKRKEWYQNNKERHAAARVKYFEENKDRLRAARRKWEGARLQNDIGYRLMKNLRRRISFALIDGKAGISTLALIGCSIEQFRFHIESLFQQGMNWDNYGIGKGKWHIDHNIPITWFNLENENCRKLACNYKNLQPLWGEDNIRKGNKKHDVLAN